MADNHSIISDRDAFGHWLSGFTDGEGSFTARIRPSGTKYTTKTGRPIRAPICTFSILLRDDDFDILKTIKAFWGCGKLHASRRRMGGSKPAATFRIYKNSDLVNVVIPHFNRYPLRAKKHRDFVVWSAAVLLTRQVVARPRASTRGWKGGGIPTWTSQELAQFDSYVQQLRDVRTYQSDPSVVVVQRPVTIDRPPGLFDSDEPGD